MLYLLTQALINQFHRSNSVENQRAQHSSRSRALTYSSIKEKDLQASEFLIQMAYGRSRASSVFEGFTLNPLPYPVLLILAVIFIFLGISWYFSYEEVAETSEQQLGWVLFATPVVLILIVRWLSSMESSDWFSGSSPGRTHQSSSEGSSPWGVAALIVVLLILMQYQSIFLDSWFV